jgi:hypothetical protein
MNDAELSERIKEAFEHFTFDQPISALSRPAAPRRRLALLAVPLAAGVAVLALILSSSAAPASLYASWTSVPSVADPALAKAAATMCTQGFTDFSSATLLVEDQRGTAAALLYLRGDSAISCVLALTSNGTTVASAASASRLTPAAGQLSVDGWSVTGATNPARGETGLTRIFGRVPAGTTAVSVVRADGVRIAASVGQGYFLAWWPSDSGVASIDALSASGARLGHLTNPAPGAAGQ